jgi:hypothetical protein
MKIDIRIDPSGNIEEFLKEAKEKKIHIACLASLDETSYSFKFYQALIPSHKSVEIKSNIEKVILSKEVGSLYPYAYLSFIPKFSLESEVNDAKWIDFLSELIFEANEKYIKSSCIVFLLDDNSIDYKRLSKLIDKATVENWKKITWLKTIILC